jgi:hypothetical protein
MGINLAAATPGMSRLAQAIGGGSGGAYDQGYEREMGLQSKLAQAMAAIEAHNASAEVNRLKAAGERAQQEMQTPGAIRRNALLGNGIPLGEDSAVEAYLQTGQLGGKYGAGDGVGPVVPAPDWASKLGDVARSMGGVQTALTIGDKNSENIAKADSIRQTERRKGDVLGGKLDPTLFAQAEYAASGKAPYHFAEFGVGNNLTGSVDDSGAPAQRFGQYRTETTKSQKANQVQSYASAGASNASAEHSRAGTTKIREETNQLINGPKGVLVQTEGGPVFADPRTGRSVPVQNPDGTPAAVAPKPLPEAAQKQLIGARNVQEAARDYMGKLQNWSNTDMLNPKQRAAMGSAYNNLMLQAKEAYNLGVLNGPDYEILQSVVADPTKLKSAIIPTEALTGQARELQRIAGNIEAQVLRSHGRPAPASVPISAAAGGPKKISSDAEYNSLPSGAEFIAPDGSRRRKP